MTTPWISPILLALGSANPQGAGPVDLTDRFQVPEGLTVTLWAASPRLYNPTAMDVDARGRVWVTEAVNYRRWDGRNPGREHPGGDRIVILEDRDGDGAADVSKVFASDPELTAPLGICVLGRRVFVSCSPNVFVYTDEDGDDVADSRSVFLTGFGGFDHDHGVHSLVAGNDGALYLAVGNAGPHRVTDAAGFQLLSGSLYNGGTPYNQDNHPGLVSSDGRVWTGGMVLRVQPDGTGLEVLAHNFRNVYEVAQDSFGNLFTADNDDDGNQACRTTWVAQGGNYGFFSTDGSRTWQADRRPDQPIPVAHWHADDPGVMPPGTINGAGGPTGVCVYEVEFRDDPMAAFDGAVLNCDAGAGVVYAHLPARRASGIVLEPSIFLGRTPTSGRAADDGQGVWFRPSDVVVAPDGAVLVADWYDPGVGGHAMGDQEAYGRILRVAPAATDPVEADGQPSGPHGHLIDALCSPAVNLRAAAREALLARGEEVYDLLHTLAGDPSPRIAARAVWVLARLGPRGVAFVDQVTHHPLPEMRVAAFQALRGAGYPGLAAIRARLARDVSPFVRAAVARSLRDLDDDQRLELLGTLALQYEGGDRIYLESIGIGAEGLEARLHGVLARARDAGALDPERTLELLWRLHPPEATAELAAWAMDGSRPAALRRRAIDALAFTPTREAADATYALAHAGPRDLRAHAAWWVRRRATNLWRSYDLLAGMAGQNLEEASLRWSSGPLSQGLVDLSVDVTGAQGLWLVVTDGGNGNSCDWADWIAPRFELADGDVPLSALGWQAQESGWGTTQFDRNCVGGPLRVGPDPFAEGIGTHAPSRLLFAVPEGARRLVAQAGPDHGGTSQGCGTSIEFQVWAVAAPDRSRTESLRAAVVDGSAPREEALAAVRELGAAPEGGLFLIELARQGRLAEPLRTAAGAAIEGNPDLGVRALAAEHFPRPGGAGTDLPPASEILGLEGRAGSGARVFFSERAQCSSCHAVRGRGRDIGPDLTAIGSKYGPAEVLEAILEPSQAIAFGYDTTLVQTVDGVLYAGFVLADAEDLVLKDSQGRRHVIAGDQVAVRRRQERSTMPEGVALGLAAQELADLIAFLLADPQREPIFGPPIELFDGRDLAGWTCHLDDPAARMQDVWSVADGVLRCEGHPIGYLRTEADYTNFELTLEWRFAPERGPGNSGVLLRLVGADKVWPKSIEAQLHAGNAGDIWNIDRFPMQVDASRTSGRRTLKSHPTSERPLGEWNRYRIRLDHGELVLEVNGLVQNTASWCEEVPGKIALQSEGAYVEFRSLVLRRILN